ncbi:hypothetical protein PHET_11220 [Paragonimus heterotremus]|uniref:Uncharacterized protein n=1 Tax=Paragonimus heterotremus TaxID=100268 RepID=A0A8J4SK08_9TREM|nr:hypothetical protein PHET_11220 [Paragonimus heterotremus]
MTTCNLYDELHVLISDVHTSLSDTKSTSLEVAREKISALIQFCHPLRQTDWNVDNADGMYFYIKAFDTVKLGYAFCKRCSDETTPMLINLVYQLQSFFVTDITQRNLLRSVVPDSVSVSQLAITLFDLGSTADRLDPRFSLPLWKLASSIIQFYKNELKHAATAEYLLILDKFLELLLSSVTFFYTDCLQQLKSEDNDKVAAKEYASLSSNLSVNLKMINLLCRIATFCIREFAITSAPSTCTALVDWFVWLISTRYAGGLFESGTDVPVLLVPHLEPSLFLCIDVTLDHLTTLPVASKENLTCSWAAVCFRHADIDAVVKLRIYSGILVNLTRHPHCYPRWLCDDFNIYADTITTCMQLDLTVSGQDMRTSECNKRLSALADDFYTSLLQRICASICGLPASCFHYLVRPVLMCFLYLLLFSILVCCPCLFRIYKRLFIETSKFYRFIRCHSFHLGPAVSSFAAPHIFRGTINLQFSTDCM